MALAAKPHAALTRIQVGEQRALLIARWCAYVGLAALVVQTEHGGCAKGTELQPASPAGSDRTCWLREGHRRNGSTGTCSRSYPMRTSGMAAMPMTQTQTGRVTTNRATSRWRGWNAAEWR